MAEQSLFISAKDPVSSESLSESLSLSVDVHRGEGAVFALEPEWRKLYACNTIDSPFCRFEWFEAWWRGMGSRLECGATSADLIALTVSQGNEIVAIATFYYYTYPWSSLEIRCLRPVGVLGYRHSDLTEEPVLLMKKGLETRLLPLLREKLLEFKSEFDLVQLHWVADTETKPEVPCRKRMLLRKGEWHESTVMMGLPLAPTWEQFLEGQSQKSQEHIRRKPRALAKRCANWRFELASPENTEFAVDELVRLHRIRAEAAKGRTIHIVSREHRLFYRDYLRRMAEMGQGGVILLWADDRVIAAQSVLFSEREWLLYHQGHDPEWAQVSPPVILQMESFKLAIESGATRIRLHRFAQEWKLRWGARPEGYFDQWISIRRTPLSLARTALYSREQTSLDVPEDAF